MNKFVKEQLSKCNTVLPEWDDNTTKLVITGKKESVNKDHFDSIHIHIENYIINEPSNFTLSSNWNGGTKPPENDMIVTIVQQMGKMYKVSGIGKSTNIHWEGWLPQKGFRIIDE